MSFIDKFFINKNRNNNENALKPETKSVSFRSSHLTISKDQIRFVLFRECDKRGRKLLFDSYSVEKVPLPSRETMCNFKCQKQNVEKSTDFIETNKTHGYKYKKPPSDVSSLGEMVFGSVAVIYKAENSCKIHCIPSPKRLMFTTIIYAPFHRRPGSLTSDLNLDYSSGSSLASLTKVFNQEQTSSSDSKLYKCEGIAQKYSLTYPWLKHSFPINSKKQCCEISEEKIFNIRTKSYLQENSDLRYLESFYTEKKISESDEFSAHSKSNLCLCQKSSECEENSLSNYGSSGITSNGSGNFSSVSGSLSSLRRRWAHSYSTSLSSTAYDDMSTSPSKKKAKLGMALILALSNTLENEIENLVFNHTAVIDGIMCKLQYSVELAYIRNENFVDLIYSAFLECQESIYELITGGKYETPIWSTILGDADDSLETQISRMNFCKSTFSKQDLVSSVQIKFLNDFCDVLVRFDTKDTNFFISTLLTAVLTHHLSWVSTIAETDLKYQKENTSVINSCRPYNPLWAQMNDLCGLLGSPLKSAKTVVTGPENKKNQLATIIEILSYFIRCNNVVENIYEVDVEDIIGDANLEDKKNDQDSAVQSNVFGSSAAGKPCFSASAYGSENEKSSDEEQGSKRKLKEELLLCEDNEVKFVESGLKRNKSFLSRLKGSTETQKLYPDIDIDLAKNDVTFDNLNDGKHERTTIFVEDMLTSDKLREKIKKLIRVPHKNVKARGEEYLSPDEGYDTIDSTKTYNFKENKVQMERQSTAPKTRNENIVFLLGENEELVNLQKKIVVNQSSFVDMLKEEMNDFVAEGQTFSVINAGESQNEFKTSKNSCGESDRTFWVNHNGENVEHSSDKDDGHYNASLKTPWVVRELIMPRTVRPCRTRRLEVSSVLGGVNQHYRSEQVIQGVLEPKNLLERTLQKDLFLSAHNPILEKNVSEALCIIGDMDSWEVTIMSSNKSVLDCNKRSGVRVGMSQLVGDMLESFLYLHTSNLPPSYTPCNFTATSRKLLEAIFISSPEQKCLLHIEKKLLEIYQKSKTVAELLNSTELCSVDYLTTSLDIGINDVPLLISVATTHSPHIAEKYVLSYS